MLFFESLMNEVRNQTVDENFFNFKILMDTKRLEDLNFSMDQMNEII